MRRVLGTLVLALVLPFVVLVGLAALGAIPGGWEMLIVFAIGVAAAAIYWRRSSRSPI